MTRYMRWLEAERGRSFGDYEALWEWSVAELEEFWASIWDFFEVEASARYSEVLPERVMPGARWFEGAELSYAQHIFRGKRRRRRGRAARVRAAPARRAELGGASRAGRRRRPPGSASWASSGATAWSPISPTSPRRWSPSWRRRRSAPSGRAARRTSAPRASPTASRRSSRRCCSASTATATTARTSTASRPSPGSSARCRRSSARSSSPTSTPLPTSRSLRAATTWAELLAAGERRGAPVRAGSVRPSALGPVLVGDHRPAEGDRPGPRRDPARAPEEAPPAPGRAGGRPRLLVHDHRLDDVELPRRGAADARLDRPLRRQPRPPGHGRALGPGRADRDELLRHQRQLRGRLHEGRGGAILGPRPRAPPRRRLHRLAALARGLRVGLRARRRATPGCSRPAAAPTSAPRSSAASRCCPSTAASSRGARWAPRWRRSTSRETRSSTRSGSS